MMAARLDVADLSLVEAADAVRKGEVSAGIAAGGVPRQSRLPRGGGQTPRSGWTKRLHSLLPVPPMPSAPRADRSGRYTGCRWRTRTCTTKPAVSPVAARPFAAISCRTTSATVIERLSAAGLMRSPASTWRSSLQNGNRPQPSPWRLPQSLESFVYHRRLLQRIGRGGRGPLHLCRTGLRQPAARFVFPPRPMASAASSRRRPASARYGVMPLSSRPTNVGPLARTSARLCPDHERHRRHDPRAYPTSAEMPVA